MKFFYFLLLSFALCLAAGCRPAAAPVSVSNKPVSVNGVPQTNLPMPMKNVETLGWDTFEGIPEKMGEYKGKVVVLDFWATYCPPCLEEIPHLVQLQNNNADLRVIGLHVGGEEDRPKVPAFVEKLKINYTLAYPEDTLSSALMGAESAIPQTFVFDRDGKLVKKFVGFNRQIKSELDTAIQEALNKPRS
jgi:cytochrome c biogenesis protein CcmG/thiol:disulfide interchange protein DsbE